MWLTRPLLPPTPWRWCGLSFRLGLRNDTGNFLLRLGCLLIGNVGSGSCPTVSVGLPLHLLLDPIGREIPLLLLPSFPIFPFSFALSRDLPLFVLLEQLRGFPAELPTVCLNLRSLFQNPLVTVLFLLFAPVFFLLQLLLHLQVVLAETFTSLLLQRRSEVEILNLGSKRAAWCGAAADWS